MSQRLLSLIGITLVAALAACASPTEEGEPADNEVRVDVEDPSVDPSVTDAECRRATSCIKADGVWYCRRMRLICDANNVCGCK